MVVVVALLANNKATTSMIEVCHSTQISTKFGLKRALRENLISGPLFSVKPSLHLLEESP